jgi:aspartyl-tRNA(Asn)/glutamyl-tRNA(Gln) amidotransferase subunit C
MLDIQTVEHVALLARIGITESERNRYQQELAPVLDFVDELKAFEGQSIENTDDSLVRYSKSRADATRQEGSNEEERSQIIANMPEIKDNALKVRQVL